MPGPIQPSRPSRIPVPVNRNKDSSVRSTARDERAKPYPAKKNIETPLSEKDKLLRSDLKGRAISNRVDKVKSGLGHTYVVFKTPEGKMQNAKMLNAVPDQVLLKHGFKQEQINMLPIRKKRNHLSDKAISDMGISPSQLTQDERKSGRILGEGGFGVVKPAMIIDPKTGNEILVAAKKIDPERHVGMDDEMDLDRVWQELNFQHAAGTIAPKVYGVADTENSNGKKEFIILMELLPGVDGEKFLGRYDAINENSDDVDKSKAIIKLKSVAGNLLNGVLAMQENGVHHGDLKWPNLIIDPNSSSFKIVDFGKAMSIDEYDSYLRGDFGDVEIDVGSDDMDNLRVMLTEIFLKVKEIKGGAISVDEDEFIQAMIGEPDEYPTVEEILFFAERV